MDSITLPVEIVTHILAKPKFKVYYPQVVRMKNQFVQKKINNSILNLVNALIAMQGYNQNPKIEILGWYELKTNARNLLSLNIGNYAYAPLAAHGLTIIKSLTFDVNTGGAYPLSSLFKPRSNYVKVLSDIVQRQITERQIPVLEEFKGIRPEQDYYIADKSLVIYFQAYEISPYVVGLPMFPVSVFDIDDIATPEGPINRMATNS